MKHIGHRLVPLDAATLVDALTLGGESETLVAVERPGEPLVVTQAEHGAVMLEVIEGHVGWCLVRITPTLTDPAGFEAFAAANGLGAACDLSTTAAAVETEIDHLGAVDATRSKGAWRPKDEADRPAWSAHLVACNTAKLRARVANDRAAAKAA